MPSRDGRTEPGEIDIEGPTGGETSGVARGRRNQLAASGEPATERRAGGGEVAPARDQDVDGRGVRSGAAAVRGGRKVSAIATAPRPIAEEPMNIHA
jgi:hypothetical protein